MQIEEKLKFATPFEWIGGEARVKALVERFYDLMDLEPGYSALRAAHAGPLDSARQKTFWFLCGWLGGPQYYTEKLRVFGVRAQIRRAFGSPGGCGASHRSEIGV